MAEDHLRRGDFHRALDCYLDALTGRVAASRQTQVRLAAADLLLIERLADLSVLLGSFQAADDLLSAMRGLAENEDNRYVADYAGTKRVLLSLGRGDLRGASEGLRGLESSIGRLGTIAFTTPGLARWEEGCRWPGATDAERAVLFSQLYLSMGSLLSALGRYDESLGAFQRGLLYTGSSAPHLAQRAELPLRLGRAATLLERGNLREAERSLLDLGGLDEVRGPGFFVRHLELHAKLNLLTGDLGAALERLRRIVAICEDRGFRYATVRASINLAHVLIQVNQTRLGTELLGHAARMASESADESSLARAAFLLELAGARSQSLADRVPIAPSVLEMWRRPDATTTDSAGADSCFPVDPPQANNYLAFFEDRALSYQWRLTRLDVGSAASFLEEMREIFRHSDSMLIRVRLDVMAGLLAYYRRDLKLAEITIGRACPILRDLGLIPELWQAQRFLGWCWHELHRSQQEQHALATERDSLLAAMTASLSPADLGVFLLNKWTADEEYIAGEVNELSALRVRAAAAPWFRRLPLRWSLMCRLHRLMVHIDRYKSVVASRTLGGDGPRIASRRPLSLVRRLIGQPRHRATLAFLVLPDRVLVLTSQQLSIDFGVTPLTRVALRNLVRRWHELSARTNESGSSIGRDILTTDPGDVQATRTQERSAITDQMAADLQLPTILNCLPRRIRSLTLVPDDSLHGFPFAAMVHRGRFLVERYALSIAFESDPRQPARPQRGDRNALLVGVSGGAVGVPSLPGVREELDRILPWLERRDVRVSRLDEAVGRTATRAALLEQLPRSLFCHLACHGFFNPERPDQSGLLLLPVTGKSEIVSLRDFSSLDLARTRHLTLSACWSADNFVLPGRWIISMPETLLRAGVHSVLGSLWPVYDCFAVSFMLRFYELLEAVPRDEALRLTQLACLRSELPNCGIPDTSDPIYWAGFSLYGDPTAFRL